MIIPAYKHYPNDDQLLHQATNYPCMSTLLIINTKIPCKSGRFIALININSLHSVPLVPDGSKAMFTRHFDRQEVHLVQFINKVLMVGSERGTHFDQPLASGRWPPSGWWSTSGECL